VDDTDNVDAELQRSISFTVFACEGLLGLHTESRRSLVSNSSEELIVTQCLSENTAEKKSYYELRVNPSLSDSTKAALLIK
jgi:hypothetical protein